MHLFAVCLSSWPSTLHYTYEITTQAPELSAHCKDVFYNRERPVISLTNFIYKVNVQPYFTLLIMQIILSADVSVFGVERLRLGKSLQSSRDTWYVLHVEADVQKRIKSVWLCLALETRHCNDRRLTARNVGPIANLKGHYFQPSFSVCLSVCVYDHHVYPSMLTDFDETWRNQAVKTNRLMLMNVTFTKGKKDDVIVDQYA